MIKKNNFDILELASLQEWQQSQCEDNQLRMERLRRHLSTALTEELTPRQQEMVRMYYFEGKTMIDIAQELGLNKSSVSRALHRAQDRLRHSLRYAL